MHIHELKTIGCLIIEDNTAKRSENGNPLITEYYQKDSFSDLICEYHEHADFTESIPRELKYHYAIRHDGLGPDIVTSDNDVMLIKPMLTKITVTLKKNGCKEVVDVGEDNSIFITNGITTMIDWPDGFGGVIIVYSNSRLF